MKNHVAGAVISVFLHLGLLLSIFAGANTASLSTQNQPIPLQLSVFVPPAIAEPEPKPETVVEADPEPITPKVEKPKPKPEPEPEPKPKPKPKPEPEPKPKPKPKPEPEPKPKPKPEPEPQKLSEPEPNPKPQPVPNSQPQVAAFGIENIEKLYEDSLNQALKRSKDYPRRAKRMRKEGKVEVSFTIHRSGAVSDVRIKKSSGSSILDKAAIQAVKKIDGLLPFPKEIKKASLSKDVPFNFILN